MVRRGSRVRVPTSASRTAKGARVAVLGCSWGHRWRHARLATGPLVRRKPDSAGLRRLALTALEPYHGSALPTELAGRCRGWTVARSGVSRGPPRRPGRRSNRRSAGRGRARVEYAPRSSAPRGLRRDERGLDESCTEIAPTGHDHRRACDARRRRGAPPGASVAAATQSCGSHTITIDALAKTARRPPKSSTPSATSRRGRRPPSGRLVPEQALHVDDDRGAGKIQMHDRPFQSAAGRSPEVCARSGKKIQFAGKGG